MNFKDLKEVVDTIDNYIDDETYSYVYPSHDQLSFYVEWGELSDEDAETLDELGCFEGEHQNVALFV